MAQAQAHSHLSHRLTRDQARAKLQAAGLLAKLPDGSDEVMPLTDIERARLGALLAGTRPSEQVVDDDRGPA